MCTNAKPIFEFRNKNIISKTQVKVRRSVNNNKKAPTIIINDHHQRSSPLSTLEHVPRNRKGRQPNFEILKFFVSLSIE